MTTDPNAVQEATKPAYSYYESMMAIKVHHFYISDVVEAPELYVDMVHRIKSAAPGEVDPLQPQVEGKGKPEG